MDKRAVILFLAAAAVFLILAAADGSDSESGLSVGSTFEEDGVSYEVCSDYTTEYLKITDFDAQMEVLNIPASVRGYDVKVLGHYWNYYDKDFRSIEASPDSKYFRSEGGVLFSKDMTQLLLYPRNAPGMYTVPDGVTEISEYAFNYCKVLTSVKLPDSVSKIGESAFAECPSLRTVQHGNGLTDIESYAFSNCSSLGDFILNEGMQRIGYMAFGGCRDLVSVSFPSSITSLDRNVYAGCESLVSFSVSSGNTVLYTDGHALYNSDKTTLYAFCGSYEGEYTVSGHTTYISSDAFIECGSLTRLTLPASLTTFDFRFHGCGNLKEVNVEHGNTVFSSYDGVLYGPDNAMHCPNGFVGQCAVKPGLTILPFGAFDSCSRLTSIVLPDGMTTLGFSSIMWCGSLTSITLPSTLTTIEDHAIDSCGSMSEFIVDPGNASFRTDTRGALYTYDLKKLVLCPAAMQGTFTVPDNVTEIAPFAFMGCAHLEGISLGKSVTTLGTGAFHGCSSLASIELSPGITRLPDFCFTFCTSLASLTIPSGITEISSAAFMGCTSLTAITIPEGVTSIGNGVFQNCYALESIIIPESVNILGSMVFGDCTSLKTADFRSPSSEFGTLMFYGCSSLESVIVNSPSTPVDGTAFLGCHSLEGITCRMGSANNSVLFSADMTELKCCLNGFTGTVTIPASVTSIDRLAFAGARNVEAVIVPTTSTSFRTVSGVLYNNDMSELIFCPSGVTGCMEISMSVKTIWDYALTNATGLSSVYVDPDSTSFSADVNGNIYSRDGGILIKCLPSFSGELRLGPDVHSVTDFAFNGCYGLTDIIVDGANPYLDSYEHALYSEGLSCILGLANGYTGIIKLPSELKCSNIYFSYMYDSGSRVGGFEIPYDIGEYENVLVINIVYPDGKVPLVYDMLHGTVLTREANKTPLTLDYVVVEFITPVGAFDKYVSYGSTKSNLGFSSVNGYPINGLYLDNGCTIPVPDDFIFDRGGNVLYSKWGSVQTYDVRWENYDGTLIRLDTGAVLGSVPVYGGEVPVRPSDDRYTYRFTGWSPEISAVEGDQTYVAVFESQIRTYTVTYELGHGLDPLTYSCEYGSVTPIPLKPVHQDMMFVKWSSAIPEKVRGDYVFHGVWKSADVEFADGSVGHLTGTHEVRDGETFCVERMNHISPNGMYSVELEFVTGADGATFCIQRSDYRGTVTTDIMDVCEGYAATVFSEMEKAVSIRECTHHVKMTDGKAKVEDHVTERFGESPLYFKSGDMTFEITFDTMVGLINEGHLMTLSVQKNAGSLTEAQRNAIDGGDYLCLSLDNPHRGDMVMTIKKAVIGFDYTLPSGASSEDVRVYSLDSEGQKFDVISSGYTDGRLTFESPGKSVFAVTVSEADAPSSGFDTDKIIEVLKDPKVIGAIVLAVVILIIADCIVRRG